MTNKNIISHIITLPSFSTKCAEHRDVVLFLQTPIWKQKITNRGLKYNRIIQWNLFIKATPIRVHPLCRGYCGAANLWASDFFNSK